MSDCISRQAVNEIINDIRDCISVEGYWAILERVKKLPPVTQKSETVTEFADRCRECGARYGKMLKDATSREAVIEWLKAKDIIKMSSQEEMARKELKSLPSVNPQEPNCQNCKHNDDFDNDICLECEYDGHTRGMTRYELQEPSGETVSLEVFKQVMWERDTAIEQLKELGYAFGEKIDDKPIRRSVIDDIKADIYGVKTQKLYEYVSKDNIIDTVIEIINKHIGGDMG